MNEEGSRHPDASETVQAVRATMLSTRLHSLTTWTWHVKMVNQQGNSHVSQVFESHTHIEWQLIQRALVIWQRRKLRNVWYAALYMSLFGDITYMSPMSFTFTSLVPPMRFWRKSNACPPHFGLCTFSLMASERQAKWCFAPSQTTDPTNYWYSWSDHLDQILKFSITRLDKNSGSQRLVVCNPWDYMIGHGKCGEAPTRTN